MAKLFTIGHGARPIIELIAALREAEIALLVDVRRFPGSKRHPHFNRDSLERSLPGAGIAYEWWGESLGGRRKPQPGSRHIAWRNDSFRAYADHMESGVFRSAVADLVRQAEDDHVAVMCSETLWWRCHRRLIADALVAEGHDVVHLGMGKDVTHELSDSARPGPGGHLIYDVGVTHPLNLD